MNEHAKEHFDKLRERAEQKVGASAANIDALSPDDIRTLVHELEVHQLELEMQNEELQRAYDKLEKSNALYSDLYDFAPVAYLTLNSDGLILEANLTSTRGLGLARDQIVGQRLSSFLFQEDQDTLHFLLRKIFKEETGSATASVRLLRPDGTLFHVQLDGVLSKEPHDLRRVHLTMTDVTAQKRAEDALKRHEAELADLIEERTAELRLANANMRVSQEGLRLANANMQVTHQGLRLAMQKETEARLIMEDANRTKSQFLRRASHELRTPLTTIKGAASSLLAADIQWSKEQIHDFLVMLDEAADSLVAIVDQLLYASKVRATGEVHIVDTPFQEIIDQALPQLEVITTEHQLNITDLDDLPEVRADHYLTAQVLVNLVENAVKFSPSNTPVDIKAHLEGEFLQVDVADQGPGIPAEKREHLFEPFQQLDSNKETGGLGLGLAVCKHLIEMQGGKIWLQSEVRKGTTISFTLPTISSLDN